MKLAFTICSNNYLAQAKTLGDSLIKHNPEYTFIIGLVDKRSDEIEYDFFHPYHIIQVEEIGILNFENIWKKFNIIELNTAVKPSFFKYIKKKYYSAKGFFYFDPDIQIFSPLDGLEEELVNSDILLTPHILTPLPLDNLDPGENKFLNYGLYNLGFLGLKNTLQSDTLLDWWEERTLTLGFDDICNGFFVDQLWLNLAPIYFKKVKILDLMGYNAAPWNLHERKDIKHTESHKYLMPDNSILVFYHFSNYDFRLPDKISKFYNRHNFNNSEEIKPLYSSYHALIINNKIEELSEMECFYVEARKAHLDRLKAEDIALQISEYKKKPLLYRIFNKLKRLVKV